ncbi:pullulanase [Bacillus thuringiensis]|uniref:Pullulanase n=1 Tax=Bacillus thuringiensis TaxID=1428 RepID=A0A9X6Q6Q2_BACTU|nr:pullulanase [Bacillus thuringiensis serovar galleriae]AKJ60719.1 pullulanase [Bacillus thuringiensis]KMQ18448.1 pullulanase [Bacillus cereus]MBB1225760.1 pullulanase [Klebsiella pneumoniae]OIX20251.1 pullulanase [Bacillus thuringiensis serovar aizawai]OIX29963.1 pullulanase [Bacillus thuringiensis serovar kurstaki]OTW67209.1 pullulanase [Bacillus thuringiensis serovar amagiensis]OTY65421.1 pullulanase [Bacillus thuringiensis serovar azorensis]OTZ36153.1 pullulanase [Bacillus thuringiensi
MFIAHLFPFATHSIIEIQRNVQPFPFILQQKTPLAELLQNFNEFFNRKSELIIYISSLFSLDHKY